MSTFGPLRVSGSSVYLNRMLSTIEGLFICGLIAGLAIGLAFGNRAIGCALLLGVPVTMFAYVWWWQSQNPDKLRSTSSLEFVFGPLWPSLGAIVGYGAAILVRLILRKLR